MGKATDGDGSDVEDEKGAEQGWARKRSEQLMNAKSDPCTYSAHTPA
jgi:hypothetical protein